MTLTPIQSLTSPAIVFPGQGSPWQQALFDVGASAPLARKRIEQLLGDAALITGPVSRPLASVVPGVAQRIREALDNEPHVAAIDAFPAVSVPAILLAQVAAAEHVAQLGLDLDNVRFGGHSQGIIGAVAGQAIPPSVKGLEFALVALFIVLAIDSFQNNKDYSLPLSAAVLGILAGFLFPGQLLMVALSAYFVLLVVRFLSPRVDSALILRREG